MLDGSTVRRLYPQVELVEGMPPTVALEQRTSAGGSRSDVGTISALSNSLRLVFSRAGKHPEHILDGAIAAWPGAWLGKNFREILETLGVDTARPWRELDEDTRQWILYTDETPIVTVLPVREAVRTQGPYEGKWESVSRYLRRTVAATQSEKNRARALRFFTASTCPTCHGHRLNPAALQVRYLDAAICELTHLNLDALLELLRRRYDHIVTRDPRDDGPEIGAERILLFTTLAILDAVTQLGLGGALIRGPPR